MNVEAASGPVMINVIVGPNWTLACLLGRAFPADQMLPDEFLQAIQGLDVAGYNGRKPCLVN